MGADAGGDSREQMQEQMREWMQEQILSHVICLSQSDLLKLESAPASAPENPLPHPLPNLIGSDRSHGLEERIRERIFPNL